MQLKNHIRLTMDFFTILLVLIFFGVQASAQNTISAEEVLERINRGKAVELDGVTIVGDLNFEKLEKKYRGGSYGVRKGVVKEYFTKLRAPLVLKNCRIKGEVITYSETERPGVVRHNFTAFDEKAIFENCIFEEKVTFEKMTFYQSVEFRNCTFEDGLTFSKVHFSQPPTFENNKVDGRLVNRETNWEKEKSLLSPPAPERETVTVVFKNSSLEDVEIRFDRTTWTLNPLGKSSLLAEPGLEIYLWKNHSKDRLLLTVTEDMEGEVFDVAKL